MRHDIPNQWEEFFHNSKQSLENAAYQDAIAQCSLALDELTQKTVATLDVRAMAFGQSANYDQGMHDALQMIKLAPSFPKGYLRSGQLYAMQGKHQLAIDMYNQGIQAVIPLQSDNNNDPDYHQLFVQRQASLDQQNRRVDFITQLPFDILPKIMSYLLPYMCAVCVDVSHSWRSRIQQCSPIWRKLIIDHSDSDDAKIYHNLAHVSDQVRELSLRGFINHIPSEFLQTLATGHFTNLQSLALRRSRITSSDALFQGLEQIRGTLKNLILISIQNEPIHLEMVLSICTNLSTFKYKGNQLTINRPSILPTTTQIVSLELETHTIIRAAQLEPLLRCCPYIQNLYVYTCEPSAIRSIFQYSTCLRSLSFNLYAVMNDSAYRIEDNNNDNNNDNNDGNGDRMMIPDSTGLLRKLYIHRVEAVAAVNLAPLLIKSRETLEEMVLNMDDDVGPIPLWNPLTTFPLPRMRKLQCQVRPIMQTTIAALIRQSSQLQEVVFEYSEYIGNEILGALSDLSQLQCLEMNSVSEINDVGLVQLFSRHGSMEHQSPLRMLGMDGFSNITDEALEYLADVTTLEKLRLESCRSVTAKGMEQFTQKLRYDCALNSVVFSNMDTVSDTALQGLCKLENLRDIQLVRLKKITDQSIADLVSTSLSIRFMLIYDCALVTKYMIKQANIILEGRQ